jgi:hypothetical protein
MGACLRAGLHTHKTLRWHYTTWGLTRVLSSEHVLIRGLCRFLSWHDNSEENADKVCLYYVEEDVELLRMS